MSNIKKGVCRNIAGGCDKAISGEIQEISIDEDFICKNQPDCGKELFPPPPIIPPPDPRKKLLIKIISIIVTLAGMGLGAFYIFSNNKVEVNVIKENLTITINGNQPLPESIANAIAQKPVEWKSSNPNIVTIDNKVFVAHSEGNATITATRLNNRKDTLVICYVTVMPIPPKHQEPTPPIHVIVNIQTISNGESTILSYSGGNGEIFKWYIGGCGETLVGEGNNLKVSPTETTIYYGRWEDGDKVSDCQTIITVTVKETDNKPSTKIYSYGTYVGELVNEVPDGLGTMKYNKRMQITKHCSPNYWADEGDSFTGIWRNGEIVSGKLVDKNGKPKDGDGRILQGIKD